MNYGILFTGQGSQFPSMAKELIENYSAAEETFKKADEILGYSVSDICTKAELFDKMNFTKYAQPAIFTLEYAIFSVLKGFLKNNEYMPNFMAGHSLGEYTALAAGEAISFEEALKLIDKRGKYMSESADKEKSTMIAVTGVSEDIQSIIDEYVQKSNSIFVACENSDTQTVYSVKESEKNNFISFVEKIGARAKNLSVEGGFHSCFMSLAKEKLKSELENYNFNFPCCCVYSNTKGNIYESADEIKDMLPKHLTDCVKWKSIINKIKAEKPDFLLEIGPMPVLSKELQKTAGKDKILHIGPMCNMKEISEEIENKINIGYENDVKKIVRTLVCSKSDGKEETLKNRERAYDYLVNMIRSGNINAGKLVEAKNIYQKLTAVL